MPLGSDIFSEMDAVANASTKGTNLDPYIDKYAAQYGVNPAWAKAIAKQESGFDPYAVSTASAAGAWQLMPKTNAGIAEQLGETVTEGDRFDPETSTRRALFHLSDLQKKLGSEDLATAAYKSGEGSVRRAGGVPNTFDPYVQESTPDYVKKINAHKQTFLGETTLSPDMIAEMDAVALSPEMMAEMDAIAFGEPPTPEPETPQNFAPRAHTLVDSVDTSGMIRSQPEGTVTVGEPTVIPQGKRPSGASGSFDAPPSAPEGTIPLQLPQAQDEDVLNLEERFIGAPDPRSKAIALTSFPMDKGRELLNRAPAEEQGAIREEIEKLAKEGRASNAFATGILASTPIPALLPEGSREEIEKIQEAAPGTFGAGQVVGTLGQVLGGGGAAATKAAARVTGNKFLRGVLARFGTAVAMGAGREAFDVRQEKKTFGDAFKSVMRQGGGAAVSVLPEMIPGKGAVSNAVIQLFGQVGTDVVYDYTTGKLNNEDVNNPEWWAQMAPSWAIAGGFAIRDISAGKKFVVEQGAIRKDAKKAIGGAFDFVKKAGKGAKIEFVGFPKYEEGSMAEVHKKREMEKMKHERPRVGDEPPEVLDIKEVEKFGKAEDIPGFRPATQEDIPTGKLSEGLEAKVSDKPPFVEGKTKTAPDVKQPPTKPKDIDSILRDIEQRAVKPTEGEPSKKPATLASKVPDEIKEVKSVPSSSKTIKKIIPPGTKASADQETIAKLDDADRDFLTRWEKIYTEIKDLATPIKKIKKMWEVEHGKKITTADDLDYKVDRVFGSGGIAKTLRDTELKPIIDKLGTIDMGEGKVKKLSPAERGKNARKLEKYLVAKTQQSRYNREHGYFDAGYSKEKADKIVASVEDSKFAIDKNIQERAKEMWAYTQRLKEMKQRAGIFDEELTKALNDPYYVPLYRDVEGSRSLVPGGDKFTTTSRGLHRLKGSTTGRPIKNIYQNLIELTNETVVNTVRNDLFNTLIKVGGEVKSLGESFKELPPRWKKAGKIEHRAEVDKVLSPELDKIIGTLGAAKEIKARTGRMLGSYRPTDERITLMFGSTESTKSHELGHHIDEKVLPMKKLIGKYPEEFKAVADTRVEGEETTKKYSDYVNKPEEKAAEFISMYLTDRPTLQRIAPSAVAEFEARIKGHDVLSKLVDLSPSRVKGIDKFTEDNWVMDTSIPKDEDVISGFVGGKMKHFRVPKELAMAVKGMNPEQLPTLLKIVALPTGILRRSAVNMNVDFVVPNIVRDQVNAAFHSKNIPGYDFLMGLKHYVKKDGVYQAYMSAGGAMDAPEAGIKAMGQSANELIYGSEGGKFLDPHHWKETGTLRSTTNLLGYLSASPFKGVANLAEASEMATRLGVFERQMKSGEDILKAMHTGRQASLDFQRIGRSVKVPNKVIPFINAAIEGVDRMGRTAIQDPKRLLTAAFVYGIAPTLGLTQWNKLNKNYKNISDREKENNYIIMQGREGKDYWKIPKSHAVKFVVNPLQMAYERALGTSKGKWTDVATNALGNASPIDNVGTVVPTALKLLIEPIANYDFYWRKTIEPEQLKRIEAPGLRFKRGTSETLKTVGKALNVSPVMMQHEINSLFSGAGKHTILALDWALGAAGVQKPVDVTEDRVPVLRRFKGKAEEWKGETERLIREIDTSVRSIKRLSVKNLQKYNKYTPQQAQEALDANKKSKSKLLKKKIELLKSLDMTEDILARIIDADKEFRKR